MKRGRFEEEVKVCAIESIADPHLFHWIRIWIRIPNADPDLNPADGINADPCESGFANCPRKWTLIPVPILFT